MKTKIKKFQPLLIILIINLFFMQTATTAVAVQAAPRVAVQISMTTDADLLDSVEPGDEITAVVTWKSVFASAGESITIQVEEGAEILIYNETDVGFKANGTSAAIRSVVRNQSGNKVGFITGSPAPSNLNNEITFKIKAPSNRGIFNMSVKVGDDTVTPDLRMNYVEREFLVYSPLSVAAESIIPLTVGEDVTISGHVYDNNGYMIAVEVSNKLTNEVVFSSATTDIRSDGNYYFDSFSFNGSHEQGDYKVKAVLLDHNYNQLGSASCETYFLKAVLVYTACVDQYHSPYYSGNYYTVSNINSVISVYTPGMKNAVITAVYVNGQHAALLNLDHVDVPATGTMYVLFQYLR